MTEEQNFQLATTPIEEILELSITTGGVRIISKLTRNAGLVMIHLTKNGIALGRHAVRNINHSLAVNLVDKINWSVFALVENLP